MPQWPREHYHPIPVLSVRSCGSVTRQIRSGGIRGRKAHRKRRRAQAGRQTDLSSVSTALMVLPRGASLSLPEFACRSSSTTCRNYGRPRTCTRCRDRCRCYRLAVFIDVTSCWKPVFGWSQSRVCTLKCSELDLSGTLRRAVYEVYHGSPRLHEMPRSVRRTGAADFSVACACFTVLPCMRSRLCGYMQAPSVFFL